MKKIQCVLIVGGGIGGLTLAAALGQRGILAEIVEIKPENKVLGVGIIQPGNALRALDSIGVMDDCLAAGFPTDEYRYFDGPGNLLAKLNLLRIADPRKPAINTLPRPALHRILVGAAERAGAKIHLGTTVADLRQHDAGVDVTLSDGSQATYDLVVGADGIRSPIRKLIFGDRFEPNFTGHGVWRFTAARPPELTYHAIYLGTGLKAGLIPLTNETLYLLLVSNEPGNPRKPPEDLLPELKRKLASFGGLVPKVVESLDAATEVIYVPIEEVILPAPWSVGRVVLIGDAAHASGPHIAQGAAMAIEDAIVLAELAAETTPVSELFRRFAKRRYERCKFVQDVSRELGIEGNLEDLEACRRRNERIAAVFATPQSRPHETRLAEPI